MGANDGGSGVKRVSLFLILVLFTATLFGSCKRRHVKEGSKKEFSSGDFVDVEIFGDTLRSLLKPADSIAVTKIGDISNNLNYVYQQTDYAPVWMNGEGISQAADSFVAELEDLYADGLNPERYRTLSLKNELRKLRSNKSPELNKLIAFDTTMTRTYLAVAKDLLLGAIKIRKADSLWYNPNDSTWNASQVLSKDLGLEDKYPSLDAYRSKIPTYNLLREECKRYTALQKDSVLLAALEQVRTITNTRELDSTQKTSLATAIRQSLPWANTNTADSLDETQQLVAAYQEYSHTKPTGNLDTSTLRKLSRSPKEITGILQANLERLRWIKQSLPETYILVDIALAELFFHRDGKEIMHMKTVVGKPSRQTPSLNADMANVVINPPWGVPPTILKKDVLPGMAKSGEAYLRKKGIQAFDRKGNRVDGSSINAGNYKRYDYRQPPGDKNALGYVKFNLPNKWDIYLHDTPHREDFPGRYRAKSSGCVRIEKPQEMAIMILAEIEGKDFTQEKLDKMISTHRTSWEVLKTKIPVHLVYLTAFEDRDNTHIRLADDVYKRDSKLIGLLNETTIL
jgi:murein L,D-transpeptidase YcbB/YkuD